MVTVKDEHGTEHRPHVIHYQVDGEDQETTERTLTPVEILRAAGIDPETHYLTEVVGHETKSYQNTPDQPIHMHEHQRFYSQRTGPTPVS